MCVCLCSRVLKTTSLSGKVAGVVCKRLQGAIAVGRDVIFRFLLSAPIALIMVSSRSLRFSTGGGIEAGSFCILQLEAGLSGLARNFLTRSVCLLVRLSSLACGDPGKSGDCRVPILVADFSLGLYQANRTNCCICFCAVAQS